MDAFLEELIREREEKAREETRRETKMANSCEIARHLIALGRISLEDIAQATGLSLDEVRLLAQEQSA